MYGLSLEFFGYYLGSIMTTHIKIKMQRCYTKINSPKKDRITILK